MACVDGWLQWPALITHLCLHLCNSPFVLNDNVTIPRYSAVAGSNVILLLGLQLLTTVCDVCCDATELTTMTRRVEALRLLVALLPLSNRDTLWALLTFLTLVTQHSTDSLDEHGNTVCTQIYFLPSFSLMSILCAFGLSVLTSFHNLKHQFAFACAE